MVPPAAAACERESSTACVAFSGEEKKEEFIDYMPKPTTSITMELVPIKSTLRSQKKFLKKLPVVKQLQPPPGFHPDFLFCGACTDCGPSSETAAAAVAPAIAKTTTELSNNKEQQKVHDFSASNDDDDDTDDSDEEPTNQSSRLLHTRILISTASNNKKNTTVSPLVLQALLAPLPGVKQVNVNVDEEEAAANLTVTVDHDAQCYPDQLLLVLKQAGYQTAEVLVNSSVTTTFNTAPSSSSSDDDHQQQAVLLVRSSFAVQGICCASEVPAVRRIVKSQEGALKLQINITTKRVYVQHDLNKVSAKDIAAHLTAQGFPAKVVENGAKSSSAATAAVADMGLSSISSSSTETRVSSEIAFLDAQRRSKYVESTLIVSNLTKADTVILQQALEEQFKSTHVRAIYPHSNSQTLKVEHNPDLCSAQSVCETLVPYGLEASVVTDGAVEQLYLPLVEDDDDESDTDDENESSNDTRNTKASSRVEQQHQQQHQQTTNLLSAAAATWSSHEDWESHTLKRHVVLSGVFWVVSMLSSFGGSLTDLKYAGLLSVFFGLPPVAMKAWRTMKRREFDANCMMVTAAVGALLLQEYDEAASVSFLFAVSEFLESRATDRARKALAEIVQLRPDHANVIHPVTKELVIVPANKVPVGTLISVRTGDKIAADGIVVEGTSAVDESSLTGESTPVRKTIDSFVSGGTINIGQTQLVVKTTCSVEESAVSRLIRLVEEAQANRSPTEKMIDGFARAYTPIVISCAASMATIPWLFGADVGRYWTLNALIIIVIACPCALTISTPVTYAAGLAAMAQRGIVVKGGASLEALGSVDKVIFDKTGTLTEGNFTVTHLESVGDTRPRKEMLSLLALMESPSSHPLSSTLVKAASREGVSIPTNVEMKEHSILKGEGVEATVDGKQVYVGNRRLFERLGMYENLPDTHKASSEDWVQQGGTVGFIGVEGEGIIGVFSMVDKVRSESKDVIASLQMGGFDVILLTGDGEGAAMTVANQIGIAPENVHSQLLPEDKLHFVGSLKRPAPRHSFGLFRRQPKVLFCGDGVNDAPAIAVADVGVSMGEGAALAMEMSDVTLMDSNLNKLVYVMNMGTRVVLTVQENILLSLVCKLVVVGLTFGGKMTLLYAIAADVGVMLLVTLNGMKLLPGNDAHVSLSSKNSNSKTRRRSDRKVYYDELPISGGEAPSNSRVAEIV